MADSALVFDDIVGTMKRTVAAFREAEIPFLLAGSLAVWAQGGPEKTNDLDFVVKPPDAERALEVLEAIGMRPERPPEDWLLKAWDGQVLVDLIFSPRGLDVDDRMLGRAKDLNILAITVPVMALEDVITSKLLALDERRADFSSLIGLARAVREQVDWEAVRRRTDASPFARACFVILEGLEIVSETSAS